MFTEVTPPQESGKRFLLNLYRQIPGMMSLPSNLTAEKTVEMKFSADKIYYNFSQENPTLLYLSSTYIYIYIYIYIISKEETCLLTIKQ